ncbi:MAG TPA: Gfo/Idh/MocA family oxidoreductase [Burkholderiaceae bacterium]|nr:Gfo/Idh/MocA family oxidoreductase [Burkholderiaceae bacterium]
MTTSPHPPLRLGILGCANIARQFARDVRPSRQVRIAAVASRDAAKARAFATEFGIARAHAGYDALLDDDELDAIYIPLPNTMHAEWAVRAAQRGRHVLCEKPLATGLAEARTMFDAARQHGVMLLEAYPWWFQPQTATLLELLRGGAIGHVRSVQASFGFTLRDPQGTNIRSIAALGGGALMDAGCYCLSLIRLAIAGVPQRVQANARGGPTGVDIATTATLHYADGVTAQMTCAMDLALHRQAIIVGSDGVITTEFLNHTSEPGRADGWGYQPSQLRVRRGSGNGPFEPVTSPTGSGFRFAAEAFAAVVAARDFAAIERAAQASLDIAVTLDAIVASARSGAAVDVIDAPSRAQNPRAGSPAAR